MSKQLYIKLKNAGLTFLSSQGAGYTLFPARYAKGQMVLQLGSDGSGMKTEAMWLAEAFGGRWVHRSHGYHLSPTRAVQWLKLHRAGFEASRKYFGHDHNAYVFNRHGTEEKLSLKEALALCDLPVAHEIIG